MHVVNGRGQLLGHTLAVNFAHTRVGHVRCEIPYDLLTQINRLVFIIFK